MHPPHRDDYALVAGVLLMSIIGFWAYTRLKTISTSQERLKLVQRVGVINAVILLITISLFVTLR